MTFLRGVVRTDSWLTGLKGFVVWFSLLVLGILMFDGLDAANSGFGNIFVRRLLIGLAPGERDVDMCEYCVGDCVCLR